MICNWQTWLVGTYSASHFNGSIPRTLPYVNSSQGSKFILEIFRGDKLHKLNGQDHKIRDDFFSQREN